MKAQSKIFSAIFLILALAGIGIFALSMGKGRLRIDHLLLSGILLLLSHALWQDAKK